MFSLCKIKLEQLLTAWLILFIMACQPASREQVKQEQGNPPRQENPQSLTGPQHLLSLVNTIRKQGCKCGNQYFRPVAALTWNEQLEKAALRHSEDMEKNNYFSHTSKRGKNTGDRIEREGYEWSAYGENIFSSEGFEPTEEFVIDNWKKSPPHCKNMMSPDFKEMGIGKYKGKWTQVFATKMQ